MTKHGSATTREHTSHARQTTLTTQLNQTTKTTIIDALKRRAQVIITDQSIDAQTRALIRYALEIKDPWLAELVDRVEAGENLAETFDFSQSAKPNEHDSSDHKLEALTEIICRAGHEPAAALLVLMARLETSTHPKALANTAKHFAFTRCGELNLYGIVDADVALVEGELFAERI